MIEARLLILHAENGPKASAEDLAERDRERHESGVLVVVDKDHIEHPVTPQDRVYCDGEVVPPDMTEQELLSKEWPFRRGSAQAPVYDDVPDNAIDTVD